MLIYNLGDEQQAHYPLVATVHRQSYPIDMVIVVIIIMGVAVNTLNLQFW
jgi:hypothetical protein